MSLQDGEGTSLQYILCPRCKEVTPARSTRVYTCKKCGTKHQVVVVKTAGERSQVRSR